MSGEFGVARETVREALRGLEQDGLIVRRRRNGTFVAKRPELGRARRLTGMIEDFSALKFDTAATVLNAKPTSPPASVVAMMGLAPNAEAFHIGRLRHFETGAVLLRRSFSTARHWQESRQARFAQHGHFA